MSKNYKKAEQIGEAVGALVSAVRAESGVFICSVNGAFGMFYAGEKKHFNEEYLDFLREAQKRIQEVIRHTEQGGLDITDPEHNGFVFKKDQDKFITFEEDEASEGGEMGMSA